MPGFDGTGPNGTGPIGRGMGPCGGGFGRGRGFGRGMGMRARQCMQPGFMQYGPRQETVQDLEGEADYLRSELKMLEQEIKERKSKK